VPVLASVLALLGDAFVLNDTLLLRGEGFFPFELRVLEILDSYFSVLSSFRLLVSELMESDGADLMLLLLLVSTGTKFTLS